MRTPAFHCNEPLYQLSYTPVPESGLSREGVSASEKILAQRA